MGLAASQARLLSLTARIHDVEYQAQMIQSAKLQLAIQEDEVYRRYTDALDAQTLTFKTDKGNLVAASFNNLCGMASMSNGLNKNYIFRTNSGNLKDDLLILPDDVYDSYAAYKGGDPYAYAMSMIGVDINGTYKNETTEKEQTYDEMVSEYLNDCLDSDAGKALQNIREQMKTLFDNDIFPYMKDNDKKNDYDKEKLLQDLLDGQDSNLFFDDGDLSTKVRDAIEKLRDLNKQMMYKLYSIGAEDFYSKMTGEPKENFSHNEAEFNYYLHWAQLIENEGGLKYCTKISDYGDGNYANDSEFLTSMLESGKITVDEVSFKNGIVTDTITSASSDNILAMSNTSDVDATEVKKAEAEYEHALKQINRKDKQYDMDLSKLETERTALTTEYDSVKKVIQDNIERTFKIFS